MIGGGYNRWYQADERKKGKTQIKGVPPLTRGDCY